MSRVVFIKLQDGSEAIDDVAGNSAPDPPLSTFPSKEMISFFALLFFMIIGISVGLIFYFHHEIKILCNMD